MILKTLAGVLTITIAAGPLVSAAFADPVNSFFPGGTGKLVDANGNVVTLGTCLALGSGTLNDTCSSTGTGSVTSGSAVRAGAYEISTPGSGPTITTPYYLTTYAELPGTITYARVSMLAASGGNYQYVVHVVHPVSGGSPTDTIVTGLNNNGVCNGESGCGAAQLATYASPNVKQATGNNTYVAGDMIYVSFNNVGGTFTNSNFHLGVNQ